MGSSVIVFEDAGYRNLLPLTYWRTVGELRTGYFNLIEYIARATAAKAITLYTRRELADVTTTRLKMPVNVRPAGQQFLLVNARLLLTAPIQTGPAPAVQWLGDTPIVIQADTALLDRLTPEILLDHSAVHQILARVPQHEFVDARRLINFAWDLVHANADMLAFSWEAMGKPSQIDGRVCEGAHILNRSAVHVGAGSVLKPGAVLDAEHGPIYIGQNVTISANASIEGPCFIGDGSLIQPGSALRHAMSIGRRCKAGGELEGSIIHGYSNKQHDGFLGHAYIGEWVNLAADTVNSDLKNTYGTVRVLVNGQEVESGQMFVGLIAGDHSKTGIGQMFSTGSVMGFGSNVATCEFAPRFVPSFTWLTGKGAAPYEVPRCLEVAKKVMARRDVTMLESEEVLFHKVAELAAQIEIKPKN